MPDPRSLRFGFGFGLLLFAAALAWLIWPSEPAGPLGEPGAGGGARQPAATQAELESGQAGTSEEARARTDVSPEPVGNAPSLEGGTAGRQFGRFQLIDAETRAPVAGVLLGVRAVGRFDARIRTDEQGRFQLDDSAEVGVWELELLQAQQRFDRLSPTAVWADPFEPVQVLYHRAQSTLAVEVVGQTGLNVAGATIEFARRPGDRTSHYYRFEADESGLLELPWPPEAGLVDGWLATARAPGEGSCLPVTIPDQPDPRVRLQLQPGTRFELRVTDLAGNPFPHTQVRLRSLALSRNAFVSQLNALSGHLDGSPGYLDERGEATWLNLPPGDYELGLRSPVGVGWERRTVSLTQPTERLEWQLPPPTESVVLAGQLLADPEWRTPVPHHYVELTDATSGELIMGTRTDGAGRFRLFGEATGEVVLNTMALEGDHVFLPHQHRFPAGTTDVELIGEFDRKQRVRLRVFDQPTSTPLEGAYLERVDSDLTVRVGRSNSQGILIADVSRHAQWQVRAPGHLRARISLDDLPQVLRLQPGPDPRD